MGIMNVLCSFGLIYFLLNCFKVQCFNRELEMNLTIVRHKLQAEARMASKHCGYWREMYTIQHEMILNSPRPRVLVAIPNLSGLADRVVGFTTVCLIAILTNRAFQIGRRKNLPLIEKVFDSPYVDYSREQDADWLIEPLKHKASIRNYNNSVLESKAYYGVNTIDAWKLLDRLLRENLNDLMGNDAKTTLISINRGKTIRMFENSNHAKKLEIMGLTPHTAFGCLTNFLIQPKPKIFLPLLEQFEIMSNPNPEILKITIQIRVGDSIWKNNKQNMVLNNFRAYFQCAEQIEEFALKNGNYKKTFFYLATESISLRKLAIEKYGKDKLITSLNVPIEHSAKEESVCGDNCEVSTAGFEAAAAEWWIMGYSHYHVISTYSGFGRTAGMRSLRKNSIYTFLNGNKDVQCTPSSFTDLETMSYDWAGI